ncbi:unnamed protein product [Chrysoparadoxa australica]
MTLRSCCAFLMLGGLVSSFSLRAAVYKPRPHHVFMSAASHANVPPVTADAVGQVNVAELKSPFLRTLVERGFYHQCTDIKGLDEKMEEGQIGAYLGFDATADSLHVGSLLQIMILRHLQRAGHKPFVLVGGGTTKIGDPSGKDESRQMLGDSAIETNIKGISSVFTKFLSFGDGPADAVMVNNDAWLSTLGYVDFLQKYGTHFTINRMLGFESVRLRLEREQPLTFLEFNYMLLQAYDFVELHKRFGCVLQLGGSDQWGNMISGSLSCGRRTLGADLYALTAPLITTSDGKKMGKSAAGAIWLNADKLSDYDYWQFWRNTADNDVIRFLKLFTDLPLEEISKLEKLKGAAINEAKIILADETTTLIHGAECLPKIHDTVKQLFAAGGGASGSGQALPRAAVMQEEVKEGMPVLDLFIRAGLAQTKGEVRRLIRGGGAKIDGAKIEDEAAVVREEDFNKGELKLSSGKKKHAIIAID